VELAGLVQKLLAGNLILNGNVRLLKAAGRADQSKQLFQFELIQLGSQMAVREKLTGGIVLPLVGEKLIFHIPGATKERTSSTVVELAAADKGSFQSLITRRCDGHCQGTLSRLYAEHVLPRYLPNAVDELRDSLTDVDVVRTLSAADAELLVKLVSENWNATRESSYSVNLPAWDGYQTGFTTETVIQIQLAPAGASGQLVQGESIRIPVSGDGHAQAVLVHIGEFIHQKIDGGIWDGKEVFQFKNGLRAKLSEPDLGTGTQELLLLFPSESESWIPGGRNTCFRELFQGMLATGNLKKTLLPERHLRDLFTFVAYDSRNYSNNARQGIFEKKHGIYLSSNPYGQGLDVGILKNSTIVWTTYSNKPAKFDAWEALVEKQRTPDSDSAIQRERGTPIPPKAIRSANNDELAAFVEHEILPIMLPLFFKKVHDEVRLAGGMEWDQFRQMAHWLEWSARRSPQASRTSHGALFELPGMDKRVRISMVIAKGNAFPQIMLPVSDRNFEPHMLMKRFAAFMGRRTDSVGVTSEFSSGGGRAQVAQHFTEEGLIGAVFNPREDGFPRDLMDGLGASPNDFLLELFPEAGRSGLSLENRSRIGDYWKRFFDFLLGEGLTPI